MKPHRWAKEIKAWADGAEIECRHRDCQDWMEKKHPEWWDNMEYRIKTKPAQEPVACPYPCGWNNLYSIIVKKGAYLAQSTIGEDEIFTSNQRNEMVQIIDYAKTLCQWGKNTHAAPAIVQEPVGEVKMVWEEEESLNFLQVDLHHPLPEGTKLYTHPAPSWQGLSVDERYTIIKELSGYDFDADNYDVAVFVEQALKEKNK